MLKQLVLAMLGASLGSTVAFAAEGSSVAGPIGGTDIASAVVPPPGLYTGAIFVHAEAYGFNDANGDSIPAFEAMDLYQNAGAGFLYYVPAVQVFGGSVGFGIVVPGGEVCGRLFEQTPKDCMRGAGDPYVEAHWSRFFGKVRASSDPGAYPIAEGLSVEFGLGGVIPLGVYDADKSLNQGISVGNNIGVIAPLAALTYTTAPILADGTEFSAKAFWNNYIENPDTGYKTGDLLSMDFAVTEHIGRLQIGLAGNVFTQVEDDELNGVGVPPDGRQAMSLGLGIVAQYDLPELGASIKFKAAKSVYSENYVQSHGMALTYVMKLN